MSCRYEYDTKDKGTKCKHSKKKNFFLKDHKLFFPIPLIMIQLSLLLAPQSGALRISAYRDFLPNPIPTTYSFRAFKPFNGDLKQPKQTKADQCRPRQTKADKDRPRQTKTDQGRSMQTMAD